MTNLLPRFGPHRSHLRPCHGHSRPRAGTAATLPEEPSGSAGAARDGDRAGAAVELSLARECPRKPTGLHLLELHLSKQ